MDILVVGSIALDTIKTPFGQVEEVLGGSATFFSYAASFFSGVRILGAVGEDFPKQYIENFQKRKIDISGIQICKGKTFRWCGCYGENLNEAKTLSVCLNVMENFSPLLPNHYKDSKYVFLANIDPEVQEAVLEQIENPILVVCDTMNLWINTKLPKLLELLKKVDILVLNEGEAKMLTGKNNLLDAGKKILQLGPSATIIKKGEHGSLFVTENDLFIIPAYPTEKVLDPTGAGDSFGGGFMGYLASIGDISNQNIKKAIVYGTVIASFVVEDFSVKGLEKIKKVDIEERIEKIKKFIEF